MSVPDSVYQELQDQMLALEALFDELQQQYTTGLALLNTIRDERNELRDERKMDIFRATLRRVLDVIDIDDPPENLATRIVTFVNNLYDEMYGTAKK